MKQLIRARQDPKGLKNTQGSKPGLNKAGKYNKLKGQKCGSMQQKILMSVLMRVV